MVFYHTLLMTVQNIIPSFKYSKPHLISLETKFSSKWPLYSMVAANLCVAHLYKFPIKPIEPLKIKYCKRVIICNCGDRQLGNKKRKYRLSFSYCLGTLEIYN